MDFEYVVRDEEVKRLHIRVRPTGGKHFEILRKLGNKQMRQKVAKFGDHLKLKAHKVPIGEPAPETVRSRENRLMLDLEQGISPTQKRAQKAAEAARRPAWRFWQKKIP